MAVTTSISVALRANEQSTADFGTASLPHVAEFLLDLTSGTIDNKADVVWSDQRTLAGASEQLDLRGVLTAALGGAALSLVEVRAIWIRNRATAAASVLLVGGGANPAFSGLFGATGDIIKVPAGGCFLWVAPLDGGGLATTAGTADMLTIDAGAATITYDVMVLGVSA